VEPNSLFYPQQNARGCGVSHMKAMLIASLLVMGLFTQNLALVSAEKAVVLYPVADNYADGKYPARAYGYDTFLYIGNKYDPAQDVWGFERIFIRFDLTTVSKSYAIARATLRLWQYYAPAVEQTYETHRVLGRWNETTQNWNNQPPWDPAVTSKTTAPAKTEVAVEWDITNDANAWHRGEAPNYGVMIKVEKEERCAECKDASSGFWSRESMKMIPAPSEEKWPKLVLVLEGKPELMYEASVHVAGLPEPLTASLFVDSQAYASITSGAGEKIPFDKGTIHNITVSKIIPQQSGVRYVCDDNQEQVSGAGSYTFTYAAEYMVSFSTDPADLFQSPESAWRRSGETVSANHTGPGTLYPSANVRRVFHGWSVNSKRVTGDSVTVAINEPTTIVGSYDTEYYLNVTSPIGETKGSGWYAKDTEVSFSIDRRTVQAEGILGLLGLKKSFTGWTGSQNFLGIPVEPQGSLVMKEPTTIEAVWAEDWGSVFPNIAVLIAIVAAIILFAAVRSRKAKPARSGSPGRSPSDRSHQAPRKGTRS